MPRIIPSGGRIRHGETCRNVNQYLKWGFVEAATSAIRLKAYRDSHVGLLYHRLALAAFSTALNAFFLVLVLSLRITRFLGTCSTPGHLINRFHAANGCLLLQHFHRLCHCQIHRYSFEVAMLCVFLLSIDLKKIALPSISVSTVAIFHSSPRTDSLLVEKLLPA